MQIKELVGANWMRTFFSGNIIVAMMFVFLYSEVFHAIWSNTKTSTENIFVEPMKFSIYHKNFICSISFPNLLFFIIHHRRSALLLTHCNLKLLSVNQCQFELNLDPIFLKTSCTTKWIKKQNEPCGAVRLEFFRCQLVLSSYQQK